MHALQGKSNGSDTQETHGSLDHKAGGTVGSGHGWAGAHGDGAVGGRGCVAHVGVVGRGCCRAGDSCIAGAGGVWCKRAVVSNADGLELRALGWDDNGWWSALVSKETHESLADSIDIGSRNAKACSREADLLNKVGDLVDVEVHELVDRVHRGVATVGRERALAILTAAKESSKVFVQMGEEEILVGGRAVGGHVHHDWGRTAC